MTLRLTQTSPDDDFEFVLTQYLDGTLDEADAARVEERLAVDATARKTLADYEKLNTYLSSLPPMPAVDWDAFTATVGAGVDELPLPVRETGERDERRDADVYAPATWVTFGQYRSYLAVAAALLIAATVAIVMRDRPAGIAPRGPVVNVSAGIAVVSVSSIEVASAPPVATIEVGPSPQLSRSDDASRYGAEDVLSRPSRMDISGFDAAGGPGVFEDGRVY